jgi:hypothetical protein
MERQESFDANSGMEMIGTTEHFPGSEKKPGKRRRPVDESERPPNPLKRQRAVPKRYDNFIM